MKASSNDDESDPLDRDAARIALLRASVGDDQSLELAFEKALRLSAQTLGIARVSVWMFDAERRRLACHRLYVLHTDSFESGDAIELSSCPSYAGALDARRAIVVDDVTTDPRTQELLEYLSAFGIGAMLDSPIFVRGDVVGVVCHEHVGGSRAFSPQDVDFAATVSDMVGLYLEQDRARSLYASLLDTRDALEKARVMEALGRMARAVGHDFNNVLAAIRLTADGLLWQSKCGAAVDIDAVVTTIETLVEQGVRLSSQLLAFARSEPGSGSCDLAAAVRGMSALLRTYARDGLEVVVHVPDEPAPVGIDRPRVEQVVMNLAVNARDAMPDGGTLTVSVTPPSAGRGAELRVSDTGVGMDEATLARVFEPYFTTKARGQGTGLGLATVYGIVTEAGGTIDVRSASGAGTEFVVTWGLPPAT